MRATRAVGLVARRELRERSKSKGFRISFVVVVLGVVALTVAPKFIDPESSTDVGVVGTVPSGFEQTLAATAGPDDDVKVTSYSDTAAGEAALDDGDIDVLWDPQAGQLVWKKDQSATVGAQVRAAATQVQFDTNAATLGLTKGRISQVHHSGLRRLRGMLRGHSPPAASDEP